MNQRGICRINNLARSPTALEASIVASKTQYDNTIIHVDGVLQTTQKVGVLAQRNLENLTGGKSYAYVEPLTYFYQSMFKPIISASLFAIVETRFSQAFPYLRRWLLLNLVPATPSFGLI